MFRHHTLLGGVSFRRREKGVDDIHTDVVIRERESTKKEGNDLVYKGSETVISASIELLAYRRHFVSICGLRSRLDERSQCNEICGLFTRI